MSVASAWHVQLYGTDPNSPVRWRLLSANNRDMGRGAGLFNYDEECRLAVKQLQADAAELAARTRRVGPSKWEWEIVLRDAAVATAGRSFDRQIRCEQSWSQFLAHFATAPIGENVMLSDSRRWRTGSPTPYVPCSPCVRP